MRVDEADMAKEVLPSPGLTLDHPAYFNVCHEVP